jgi:hypothetical protein
MSSETLKQKFLEKLCESADIAEALSSVDMQMHHLMAWCKNDEEFDKSYRSLKHLICSHLKSEAYMAAIKAVVTELTDPMSRKVLTITNEIIYAVDEDGEEKQVGRKIKTDTRDRPIAAWAIKEALTTDSFLKALDHMVSDGVLSNDQYKKLLTDADKCTASMRETIGRTDTNKDSLTERTAIALIRQAVEEH